MLCMAFLLGWPGWPSFLKSVFVLFLKKSAGFNRSGLSRVKSVIWARGINWRVVHPCALSVTDGLLDFQVPWNGHGQDVHGPLKVF